MRVGPSRQRGFTLIEIMIVVAIVGVMAGLAASNLRQQQTRSRFRSSVRDMVSIVREARSNALLLGSGLATPNTVINTNCPIEMLPNQAPFNWANFQPGVVIDTNNSQVTLLDGVSVVASAPGTAGSCVAPGLCVVNSVPCTGDLDCPGFPQYTIRCRTEDFVNIYRNEARVIAGGVPGTATAGALVSFASNAGRAVIGFNGRGQMVTRNPGQQVGRIVIQENVGGSPMALSIIVSEGGTACVEGAASQCARVQ